MDLMLHIAHPDAGPVAAGLAAALNRAGVAWGCFLTNDGVRALKHDGFRAAVKGAARAAVCELSWHRFMGDAACPVELGSQTTSSALLAEARRVLAL